MTEPEQPNEGKEGKRRRDFAGGKNVILNLLLP